MSATLTQREPLWSRAVAAEYIGVKPQTLAVWHSTKRHVIPVVKVGSRAMYRPSDLERFIAENTVGDAEQGK